MSNAHSQAYADGYDNVERYRTGRRVTVVSVFANLLLTAAQVAVGLLGHSQALIADGVHTLSDLVTDFLVLFALKHSHKEADEDHPYGHARIETAVTMLLGIVLVAVGIGIAARAGINLASQAAFIRPSAWTLWTAGLTLAVKEGLYRYTMRTANRFNSDMLRANAWHHRSDAISSLIVAFGIGGSMMGLGYLDSAAAIVVALMILKVGADLSWHAAKELVDTGLAPQDLEAIRRTILSVAGVKALHLLRTRRLGGRALVDVHILVDDRVSVSEGHQISEAVRARLISEIGTVADAMVHIDTEEDVHDATCSGLPLRDAALQRLGLLFGHIPEGRQIERATLHYANGRITVELLLPLALVSSPEHARRIHETFNRAIHGDRVFGEIQISFR